MPRRKPIRKSGSKLNLRSEQRAAERAVRATYAKALANRLARVKRTFRDRQDAATRAVKSFRPRKADRGSIIFIGTRGGRINGGSKRQGYGVYVTRTGKKRIVKPFNRDTGRAERIVKSRTLGSLDVSTVRSKKAKQKFLTQYLNPAIRGELRKNEKGLSKKGARFSGKLDADKFYTNADAVTVLARDLVKAVNSQRSKRTFLVTIGIHVRDGSGGFHWVETSQPINRADGQDINFREAKQYLGRVIYAFLARELSDRDLVLQGSARHIGSLKANKGKKRDKWEKDGFLWQGHDQKDVSVVGIEYRIDHQTLS